MTTCPACGSSNPENAAFCQHCGANLSGQPTNPTASSFDTPAESLIPPAQPVAPQQPPAPQAPYAQQINYGAYPPSPRPLKDRSIALILEILPGLFGFYGIGRIYSGDTQTGILWLAGGLAWAFIAGLVSVFTGGIACFCTIPLNLAAVATATYLLNQYTKNHPEIFGA